MLGLSLILPLLHLYAAIYGAAPLDIGIVMAAFPLAQLISLPVMGMLSDRFGRKPLLLISQISTCIGFIVLGLANSLILIVVSRLIDGLLGANISTAQAALSDITDDNTRAQGLGLIGAAFGLGFILGPIISLVALGLTNNIQAPAFVAAALSGVSIVYTLFGFTETLPSARRGLRRTPLWTALLHHFHNPKLRVLLIVIFIQQLVFFGFESLIGLFALERLGLLEQGVAVIFVVVGLTLVLVQGRFIGRWSRRYGDASLAKAALGLLSVGLVLIALTPAQPHPGYHRLNVETRLSGQTPGDDSILVDLPQDGETGITGVLWLMVTIIPLSVGAGLIRPSLNSLMTKQVSRQEYGSILGLSSSFISAANAAAPLLAAAIFHHYGSSAPFLTGAVVIAVIVILSRWQSAFQPARAEHSRDEAEVKLEPEASMGD
jgi:DHA1 family tetracycline resistance protein-like MFS transporter